MSRLIKETSFSDLVTRENAARNDLANRLNQYKKADVRSTLDQAELDHITAILDTLKENPGEVCDPLFVTARQLFNDKLNIDPKLVSQEDGALTFSDGQSDPSDVIPAIAITIGLLVINGATPPPVKAVPKGNAAPAAAAAGGAAAAAKAKARTIVPDTSHPWYQSFVSQFYVAFGEATGFGKLGTSTFVLLAKEGDSDGPSDGANPWIDTTELARTLRGLRDRKVTADEPQLRRRVNEQLNQIQNVGGEDAIADLGIDLPDLEDISDTQIVAENVQVMGPMIVAAMFDELKVFQVVDRIVEQFQQGTLPIGPGNAGKQLYKYWRETPNRISEHERKNFASITLGIPGGDPNVMVNREFNDLWIRFVSSVSTFVRQTEVDALLRAGVPSATSHQQVRKAARDLAGNLSLHGYGMAHYAAREIQYQVKFMIDLLQDAEIRGCYGAKDMWQVIDQVATYDLGGAKTSSRYRTLATCGTIITAWLAKNVVRINKASGPLLNLNSIRQPDITPHKSTVDPTDYDLVNACELWLADTATNDTQIEQFSQPREAPQMTSKPVTIPSMARDMLDGIGDLGVGLGGGVPAYASYGANGHAARH